MMMLLGFAVTAGVVGKALEPFSAVRLVAVTAGVGIVALAMTVLATWRIEPAAAAPGRVTAAPPADFRRALAQVWAEPVARRFTVFVFVSMFAYSAQELLLEPFAGAVYHLTPGGSAQLAGLLHGGVFGGMLIVAVLGTMLRRRRASMRGWAIGGCAGSALALLGLTGACVIGPAWPLSANVVVLGVANGCFVIAAIGSMMDLAGSGARPDGQGAGQARDGVRMGLWGAAQAIAFALGGLAGTSASDFARHLLGSPIAAYATVFAVQAVLFLLAAWQANLVFRNLVFRPGRARSADQTQANHTQPHGQRRPDPQMRDGGAVVAIQG
jgi:BCD family chlorophyll transporter-like MFS transporter